MSPIDGSVIGSRADLREHNARCQVVNVGNEDCVKHPKASPDPDLAATRDAVIDSYRRLGGL